jgi:hypothetical protein
MPGWMHRMNEWRVGNWDLAAGSITMGQYLSNVVVNVYGIVSGINPNCEQYLWNDMFDPYHNATTQYVMDKGSVQQSWGGVNQNIVIMNWYNAGTTANMKFWNGLDAIFPIPRHRQFLSGYYDSGASLGKDVEWSNVLIQAEAQGVRGVVGYMYTTWGNNFTYLKQVADFWKSKGRWGTGPAF